TVKQRLAHPGRDRFPWLLEGELVMRRQRFDYRLHVVHPSPRRDHPVVETQILVLHHQLGIEVHDRADARAFRAGAVRTIEREHSRRDFRIRDAAGDAGEALTEVNLFAAAVVALQPFDLEEVAAVLEGNFERIGEPLFDPCADSQAIDHHVNRMPLILVQRDLVAQLQHLAVDLDADEAGAPQVGKLLAIFAFAIAHNRRQHLHPRTFRPLANLVDDLLYALLRDFATALVAEGVADAREKQPQIIIDLGYRRDRRTRIARAALLLDRDRRRQSLDRVNVRLLHLFEELSRVGRERFDIPTLALRIDRVKGQRRFARAAEPCDHHQLVARNLEIEVLEIVLARALDNDAVHRSSLPRESRRWRDTRRGTAPGPCAPRPPRRKSRRSCSLRWPRRVPPDHKPSRDRAKYG